MNFVRPFPRYPERTGYPEGNAAQQTTTQSEKHRQQNQPHQPKRTHLRYLTPLRADQLAAAGTAYDWRPKASGQAVGMCVDVFPTCRAAAANEKAHNIPRRPAPNARYL